MQVGSYDHATAVDEPLPELARCLDSLDDVRGVIRTIILLVASPSAEAAARARVNAIVRDHPALNPLVIGSAEARLISGRIDQVCPGMDGETVSLRGYGAIRNMGLVVSALLGHDVVVFMDDDEVLAQAVIELSASKERTTSAKSAGLANAAKPVDTQAAPAATQAAPAPASATSHEAPPTHESATSGKEEECRHIV